jgi:hypothetical protein
MLIVDHQVVVLISCDASTPFCNAQVTAGALEVIERRPT